MCEKRVSEKKRKKNRHLKHFILLFDVQTLKYHLSSSFALLGCCVCVCAVNKHLEPQVLTFPRQYHYKLFPHPLLIYFLFCQVFCRPRS